MDTFGLSMEEYNDMAEAGRQMACRMIAVNPEARRRVENQYGTAYCRRRYPEAYEYLDSKADQPNGRSVNEGNKESSIHT